MKTADDFAELEPERILAKARARMAAYQQSGNLSGSGAPKRRARDHDLDAGPEKSSRQVDREVTGDTIDALGVLRYRPRGGLTSSKPKGEALKRQSDFSKFASRPGRPVNSDGATSFHFSYDAISKTRNGVVPTRETERWLAPQHASYLEREAAVAKLYSANVEAARSATEGGLYIERDAAVAHTHDDGSKAIYSNISEDSAEERQRFWELVEARARKPKPDKLEFNVEADPPFWSAIAGADACPVKLRAIIAAAVPGQLAMYEGGNNEELRRLFDEHGWEPPGDGESGEVDQINQQKPRRDCGAVFRDGRGEVVQLRLVGELPNELSMDGKVRALTRFASFFDERGLPYVAVMHAPDHSNNKKNWHFHLAAYERPCRRFVNEEDFIQPLPPEATQPMRKQDRIARAAIGKKELEAYVGEWDFAVPVRHKTSSRHTIDSYAFRQQKDRDCNDQDFPEQMRRLLAEVCNDELQRERHYRRYDPRKFDDMGIAKSGDAHLGTKAAQLEKFGVPTPLGQENEAKQWHAITTELEKDHQKRLAEARHTAKLARSNVLDLDDTSKAFVCGVVDRWENAAVDAELTRAAAAELGQILDRSRSRAMWTKKECEQHLTAIEAGSASKRHISSRKLYELRLAEADEHLAGTDLFFADQRRELVALQSRHIELSQTAERLTQVIQEETAVRPAYDESWRDMLGDEPSPKADEEPARQPVEASADRSLDVLLADIVASNRRLVLDKDRVVLREASRQEVELIASISTKLEAARLLGIKRKQDALIGELQQLLRDEPSRLRITRSSGGAERLSLQAGRPDLHRAFRSWAFEPDVKPFVQRALDRNQEAARVKQRATAVESAVERVIFNAIPVFQDVSGAQTSFRLDPGFLPKLGLAAEDLSNPIGQGLLAQAHVVQTKDIQRLAAFATKYPGRIVLAAEVAGAEATLVIKNGPPDLRSLALRYRNHPAAQQALRKAVASERCLSAAPVNMRGKGHSQGRDSAHQAAAAYSTTGQTEY